MSTHGPLPPVDVLRSLLRYEPETGHFFWLDEAGKRARGCTPAGGVTQKGYRRVFVSGKYYAAHRLAWLHHYGIDPHGDLDHINGDKSDNRIANLRVVSTRENHQNLEHHRAGRLVGTTFLSRYGKWQASVCVNGKRTYLGVFSSEEDAHQAYMKAIGTIQNGGDRG